jgi:hypothetical protein
MKFTEARSQLSRLYSRISEGGVEVIERNQECDVVIANASEYRQLLERQAPFRIEVRFGAKSVAAWIKGLPVHAEGETVEAAIDELAVALVDYASAWEKHLQHAPNHRENIGYVRRTQIAGSTAAVRQMLALDAAKEAEEYNGNSAPAPVLA